MNGTHHGLLLPEPRCPESDRVPPDFEYVRRELGRPSVTLLLLWDEYVAGCWESGGGAVPYRYSKQQRERLAFGSTWVDTGLTAINEDGSPIRPETCSAALRRHCAAAGVPVIRPHGTRHTAATRMLGSGTTVSAAAKWLGRDPAMTLRVYGRVYDDALAAAGGTLLGGYASASGENG